MATVLQRRMDGGILRIIDTIWSGSDSVIHRGEGSDGEREGTMIYCGGLDLTGGLEVYCSVCVFFLSPRMDDMKPDMVVRR